MATLPSSGTITLSQIGLGGGAVNLGDPKIMTLAGLTGSAISMSQLYGKSGAVVVSLSPPSPYAIKGSTGTGVVSASCAASAAGGSGTGYTYAWAFVSGTGMTVSAPAQSNTAFSKSLANNVSASAVYRCTVTDSLGAAGYADATVLLEGFAS